VIIGEALLTSSRRKLCINPSSMTARTPK